MLESSNIKAEGLLPYFSLIGKVHVPETCFRYFLAWSVVCGPPVKVSPVLVYKPH